MAKISNGNSPALQLVEQSVDFDAPAAGFIRLFAKSDGLYVIDSASNVIGPFLPLGAYGIDDLADVDTTGLADADILVWDAGASNFVPTPLPVVDPAQRIALFIAEKPSNNELVLRLAIPNDFDIPSGAGDNLASSRVGSSGSVAFDMEKNGTSFGSITFATSATGTFSIASPVSFVAGDILTIRAPAVADATLEDISITLVGVKT
jgi:hypothetical protein